MTFIQVLIFSFGFFGVWCVRDFCVAMPSASWRQLGTGLVFILMSFVLSIGFVRIG
jgi:hypothetical protein